MMAKLDVSRTGFKTVRATKDESISIFDKFVKTESSLFDGVVQESSLFDEIVDKSVDEAKDNWDDRLARTLTLAENLVEIRNSIKGK
jgi:hypothetical protein